jgi:hypothetical protein
VGEGASVTVRMLARTNRAEREPIGTGLAANGATRIPAPRLRR